jgi:predicted aminopeptidase
LKLNLIFALLLALTNVGCQLGFYIKSATGQLQILTAREPIEKVLADTKTKESDKEKLRWVERAREFCFKNMNLKPNKNYTQFVQLNRSAVTFAVSAAPKWELRHHLWSFPFVGEVPYKGFFNESDAIDEENDLKKMDLDTFRRGVSAYSTLGWFNDPVLSSMLAYKTHDLVNTIIHENVHATLYIASAADFNERLAVFLGDQGTLDFYRQVEGENSPTVQLIKAENKDQSLFADFITKEILELKKWYTTATVHEEAQRQQKFQDIKDRFKTQLAPQLQTKNYERFTETPLNNARLMLYKTYVSDLSTFEKIFKSMNNDYRAFIAKMKTLEKNKDPETEIKLWTTEL